MSISYDHSAEQVIVRIDNTATATPRFDIRELSALRGMVISSSFVGADYLSCDEKDTTKVQSPLLGRDSRDLSRYQG
jgi:hypothetical protein